MTETQRRIKELKRSLPNMKEKVVAVAVLLALSLTMMASVSYAWYTLSSTPELSSIQTTVASNGSLEVALAGRYDAEGNLLEPDVSAAGDSFSAEGQSVISANLTWGNLINLSNHYGIESLELRPATFSDTSPAFLTSMKYSDDGRVDIATNKFDFTSWNDNAFTVPEFPIFGVRAISSVRFQETDMEANLAIADGWFDRAKVGYRNLVENSTYTSTIRNIMQDYLDANVSAKLNNGESQDIDCTKYIETIHDMMLHYFEDAICNYGEALVALANAKNPQVPYTLVSLMKADREELEKQGIDLDNSWAKFKSNYTMAYEHIQCTECREGTKSEDWHKEYICLQYLLDSADKVMWSDLEEHVDALISINKVQIVDSKNVGRTVSQVTSMGYRGIMDLMSELSSMSAVPVVVHEGLLKDFEEMCGHNMLVNVQLSAVIYTIKGQLQTSLRGTEYTPLYYKDRETIASGGPVFTGKKEADDTYGMVIDLWVRTNAADSFLILDGVPKTVTYEALRKIIPSGTAESKQAFIYTYNTGNVLDVGGVSMAETATIQLFQIPEDLDGDEKISTREKKLEINGEEVIVTVYEGRFYDTTAHSAVELRDDNGNVVTQKDEEGNEYSVYLTHEHFWDATTNLKVETYTYEVVTGFVSSNRIDGEYTDNAGVGEISVTQGSGSCYIFYASPEEADSTLALLSHLKLAFCDANGKKLASARLAVEYVFADSGKYVVPIVIDPTNLTYELTSNDPDAEPKIYYGITSLEKNTASLISVVVYLDGEDVDNSMVMEKGTVQGSLNLQFASNANLKSLGDSALSNKTISVSAAVGDNKTSMELEFDPNNLSQTTVSLKATVLGVLPQNVKAIFRRQVNASQGTALEPVTLNADLTANVTFEMPGVYVLRSLWVDGIEYALPESSWITVTVKGFNIVGVEFCEDKGQDLALTADNYVMRDIDITFSKGEQVHSVTVRFLSDDNEIVDASLHSTDNLDKWSGAARFQSSGHYTLTYVKVNGEFYEVPESMRKDLTAYLGLRAEVTIKGVDGTPLSFPFNGNQDFLVSAKILTDNGTELKNLEGLHLYYGKRGSSILENGLDSPLTWQSSGYYTGRFTVTKVGTFNFAMIQIGTSVITGYTKASAISAIAVDPPEFVALATPLWDNANGGNYASNLLLMSDLKQEMPAGQIRNGYYMIQLKNSSGADVFTAVFADDRGTLYPVSVGDNPGEDKKDPDGSVEDIDDGSGGILVYFQIPVQNGKNSNGNWKLAEIRVSGVYDADGNFYGVSNDDSVHPVAQYYTLKDDSGSIDEFSVLEGMDVNVSGITLGSSLTDAADFMTAQPLAVTTNGVKSYISAAVDAAGLNLSSVGLEISNVTFTLNHIRNSTDTYGGYSYTAGSTGYETMTFDMENIGGKWCVPESAKAYLAGAYNYSAKITVDQINDASDGVDDFQAQTFTVVDSTTVVLTVWSKIPSVKITSAYYANGSESAATITDTSTTVYTSTFQEGGCMGIGATTKYRHPRVVIGMTGYGGASRASLSFTVNQGEVHLYSAENSPNSRTTEYIWTGNTECTRYIGYVNGDQTQYTKAGVLKATSLVMTVMNGTNTATFTVDIADIQITGD